MTNTETSEQNLEPDSPPSEVDAPPAPGRFTRFRRSLFGQATLVLLVIITVTHVATFMLTSNELRRSTWTAYEASRDSQSIHLAEQLSQPVRSWDQTAATTLLDQLAARDPQNLIALRAFDANLDLVVDYTFAQDPAGVNLAQQMPPGGLLTEMDVTALGQGTIIHLPIWSPLGADGPAYGVLELYHNPHAIRADLQADLNFLLFEEILTASILLLTILFMLNHRVLRPLARISAAMHRVAEDETDVDLAPAKSAEIQEMQEALLVFQNQNAKRIEYSKRNKEAEARNEALRSEQAAAAEEDRRAQEERAAQREDALRVRQDEQSVLVKDLETLLAAAVGGQFDHRMPVAETPEEQLELRNLVNALMERVETEIGDVLGHLGRLSDGVLSARLGGDRAGTFKELQTSTNALAETLQEALVDISEHASGMLDDTSDLSASAENLSKRTENTAATLADTTSALERIVGNIASTAKMTAEVNEFADTARGEAARSDEVVRDAVKAMEQIRAASDEISSTLVVINDIAFQTNLLALNAGVEAARAGEAGRGFAVVASEVRALAQRAADAAGKIDTLIATSDKQIDLGVQQVGRTGETLSGLGVRIEEIGGQVQDIAHATDEQSRAATELKNSLTEIDAATQQNTAMFEEMSTANLSLKGAASRMLELTKRFDTEGEDAAFQAAWQKQDAKTRGAA